MAGGSAPQALQRASGALRLSVKRTGEDSVIDGLHQQGCLKLRFPRRLAPGWLDAVAINTGGGVAGGDRLTTEIALAPATRATITAQAAERFYRRIENTGPAIVRTRITVNDRAEAEWLPQESILFNGSAVDRRLDIVLHAAGRFLGLEALIFGRQAMGETVERGWLRDLVHVTRDGTPILHDAIRLEGAVDALLQRPAIAGGGRAVATILLVAPDAEARLACVRAVLATAPAEAGASAWNGMVMTRIVAQDGAALRRTIIASLRVLRDDRPLPRVWMC